MKNKIITGIPRSGTSLLTSLIAEYYESVVFSEPNWMKEVRVAGVDCESFTRTLVLFIERIRADVKNGRAVELKINPETNLLVSNYFSRDEKKNIKTQKEEFPVVLPKHLVDKTFFIKTNAQFTACLGELIQRVDKNPICVIRNPVACLMSWRSLKIPVSFGNMKIAEKYCAGYLPFIASAKDLLHKQVLMIDWFFKQYLEKKDDIILIKYEDLMKSPNTEIAKIIGFSPEISKKFTSKNKSKHYNIEEEKRIVDYLIKYGVYYKEFYATL